MDLGGGEAELLFEFAEFVFGGEVHGLILHHHHFALDGVGHHLGAGLGFGLFVLDFVTGGGEGPFVLVFEGESFEGAADGLLDLGLLPLGLHGEGFGGFLFDFFFLPFDGDFDLVDGFDGLGESGAEGFDSGVVAGFLAEELFGEFAVALSEGGGGLGFELTGLSGGVVEHLLEAVALGDRLDGLFAVAGEGGGHVSPCLVEHDLGVFELVHCLAEEGSEPCEEAFHLT